MLAIANVADPEFQIWTNILDYSAAKNKFTLRL